MTSFFTYKAKLTLVLITSLWSLHLLNSQAQSVIYSTNFGTTAVNASTLISGPPSLTRSGAAETNFRLATASASSGSFFSGLITASGGANFADGDAGTVTGYYQADLSGISTVGFTNIQVGYIARKTNAHPVTLTFEWSGDGVTWNGITYTDVTNAGTWQAINGGTLISLPPGAGNLTNLRFRWYATRAGINGNYRIDDFHVFGTSSGGPTSVGVSVSPTSVSETGQPTVTITATASAPVSGNQTVDYTISGTGITAGDFVSGGLTGTITILDGQTSGTATRQILDDAIWEGNETATVTISNPSAGIVLGLTTTNFSIVDNDDVEELLFPQYIQGLNGTNNNRVPFVSFLKLNGLLPNATYRYYTQIAQSGDVTVTSGAGNPVFLKASGFEYPGGAAMNTAGQYDLFTTDANGSYSGWFGIQPTGNARFTPGNDLFLKVVLNNGAGGTSAVSALQTHIPSKVINLVSGSDGGRPLRSTSCGDDKNLVMLWDNESGTGRPIAGALIESDGAAAPSSFAQFYRDEVDGNSKVWGTVIPENLPNGIRRIEQFSLSTGSAVGLAATDADGTWPTGSVNTANPTGGTAALVIANADAPLVAGGCSPVVNVSVSPSSGSETAQTTMTITVTAASAVSGNQTVDFTITGSGVTSADFVGTPSLTGTLTILDGQTTGTATYQIFDDSDIEGPETATVTISNPSAGITISGSTANFTISDNDANTLYSRGNGDSWTDAIWAFTPSGTPSTVSALMGPGRFRADYDVVIQTGHTVNWTQTDSVKNLTVESGALLRRNNNNSAVGSMAYLRVFGNSVTVNGQLGEAVSAPNFDAIGLDIASPSCDIEGSGTYLLARLRNNTCPGNCAAVIKRNMTLTFPGATIFAEQNDANFFVTINAGVTVNVTGTAANGSVSIDGTNGTTTSQRGGSITVNGTLNVSDKVFAVSNNNASFPCSVVIGPSGKIKTKDIDINIDGTSFTAFTINSGGWLEVDGIMTVKGGTLATNNGVIINNDAILLHGSGTALGGGEVSGNVIVKRTLPTADRFHYIGSPVSNVGVSAFGITPTVFNGGNGSQLIPQSTCDPLALEPGSPWASLLELRENANVLQNCSQSLWHVKSAGTLENARGYAAMAYTGSQNLSFNGTVNNGTVTYGGLGNSGPVAPAPPTMTDPLSGLIYRGWHLVSNPYPSPITFGSGNAALTSMGFAAQVQVWNAAANTWIPTVSNTVIPVGQAFQIRNAGTSSPDFTTTNAMRTATSATFYSMPWEQYLTVSLENENHNMQTLIFFHEEATDGFDPMLEANRLFGGAEVPVIYTLADANEKMAYNGYAPLYNETKTVVMGVYDGAASGPFSLRFQDLNTLENTSVTLEDIKLNTFTPVNEGFVYNFTTAAGDERDRFRLHFSMLDVSGINTQTQSLFTVYPNPADDMVNIAFADAGQAYTLLLTDLSGKTLMSRHVPAGTQNLQVAAETLASGVYLLEVRSAMTGERNVVKLIRK